MNTVQPSFGKLSRRNLKRLVNLLMKYSQICQKKRIRTLSKFIELLIRAKDPLLDVPLLSARYHLFLRSIEGAFVSYFPHKRLFLERRSQDEQGAVFEIALCRECGQHYLVGRLIDGRLQEAIRDPGHPDFGAIFFRPIECIDEENYEEDVNVKRKIFQLCIECGAMVQINRRHNGLRCGHMHTILVEQQEGAEEKKTKFQDAVPADIAHPTQCGDSSRHGWSSCCNRYYIISKASGRKKKDTCLCRWSSGSRLFCMVSRKFV